jgi:3'-phosphoadenosine 5'-phosphosulfate sulfotransferase (PAPS reductase)/FAD synthetase
MDLKEVSAKTDNHANLTDRMDIPGVLAIAVGRVNEAIRAHVPVASFGMISGGHDSLTASFVASLAEKFTGCAHINTGIGVEETREFVRNTCRLRKWPLLEYKAMENVTAKGKPDPQDYRALALKYGFPGPGQHGTMYIRLKERQVRRLVRDHKTRMKDRVLLITGVRSQESERRMGTVEPIRREGAQVWVSPIHDFSKLDCSRILKWAGFERNPVVDFIHKSGECLCGAFAKPEELAELALWYPHAANQIKTLAVEVMKIHPWGWGQRPPGKRKAKKSGPLCSSCDALNLKK